MALTPKEETPDRRPTMEDLATAMADLGYAKGIAKDWANLAKSARAALESHEREHAKAQLEVARFQAIVDKTLKRMQ